MKYAQGWRAVKVANLSQLIDQVLSNHLHTWSLNQHADEPCDSCLEVCEWEENPLLFEDEIKNAWELVMQPL